jgi:hypothetical protein
MPSRYWVIGGDYTDTGFHDLVPGTEEDVLGPFDNYEAAHTAWQAKAWSTVDSCTKRYRIVEDRGRTKVRRFYVIGGDYIDTHFRQLAPGSQEERDGPFDSYEQAHKAWQSKAWSTVDACTKRFRIVEEVEA